MKIRFHSRDSRYKQPFGAVPAGETVKFWIETPKECGCDDLSLIICHADQWNSPQVIPFSLEEVTPQTNRFFAFYQTGQPALLFYHFSFMRNQKPVNLYSDDDGHAVEQGDRRWQLTVYDPAYETPDFIKGGLYYQIFPDRFFRSGQKKENVPPDRVFHPNFRGLPEYLPNAQGQILCNDYFGGDLPGIIQKLPYLQKLGVTCLYLNPIFEAHANHRYNTADYKKIDPLLGNESDFRALCDNAHKIGISVVLDGVFSHTGSDSIYFNKEGRYGNGGAYQNPKSPYFSWYRFQQYPQKYESWWGFDTLPNVEETDPSYLEFICGEGGVLDFWLDLGADGFRLDVADELPDLFLDAVRQRVKSRGAKLVIGEVWEDASNKIAYGRRRRYLLGSQLDGVMNYPFGEAILSFVRNGGGQWLDRAVWSLLENYPPQTVAVLMNCLSTHDIPRAITALAGEELQGRDRHWQAQHHELSPEAKETGKTRLKLASLIQYFLPGVPSLYYGDEAGLGGYRDPFNRCPYPWGEEDKELLDWFFRLGSLRKQESAVLAGGRYLPMQCDQDLYSFQRIEGGRALFVAVNRGDIPRKLLLPHGEGTLLLGDIENGLLAPGCGVVLAYDLLGSKTRF